MMKVPMACGQECPMQQALGSTDIQVENTKLGATVQLVAENAADVAKVQELARHIAAHLAQHSQGAAAHAH
jgi:hypothetical protein